MNPPSTTSASPVAASPVAIGHAKAYCGAAHGQSWSLDAEQPMPERVELGAAGEVHIYRLVHDPRRGRPARDHVGNYLYMPMAYGAAPSAAGPLPLLPPETMPSSRLPRHRAALPAHLVG